MDGPGGGDGDEAGPFHHWRSQRLEQRMRSEAGRQMLSVMRNSVIRTSDQLCGGLKLERDLSGLRSRLHRQCFGHYGNNMLLYVS